MAKKRKIRVELRKNRYKPPRDQGWTRGFHDHGFAENDVKQDERVRAKGDLSRRRTVIADTPESGATAEGIVSAEMPSVDESACLRGRVLRVHGLQCWVSADDGRLFRCVVRRVLRNLVIEERNIVATGDVVWFGPAGAGEGVIERVEPRHGCLTRASRGKEQVIVANVDQLVIVASLAEPALKPHLIDRYLASAVQGRLNAIVCLNKADLVDPADYQPYVGLYSQLGWATVMTSATTGQGIAQLQAMLVDRETVFSGQSGVGKTSLLNAIQPELDRKVREVSETNQKGRHTTTTTELVKLEFGGWVVDTPGIRQFDLWDLIPEEVEGLFPDFHPYIPHCRYPDCPHSDEAEECAVKRAVAEHQIAVQRYESFLGLFEGKLVDE